MLDNKTPINRRKFLEKSLFSIGGLALLPSNSLKVLSINDWPETGMMARNTVYKPNTLAIRNLPYENANIIRNLEDDECVPWLREVIGEAPAFSPNKKWVETPEGYVFASSVQKVKNHPNEPITALPTYGEENGMWVEVTVPYVNIELANSNSPWSPWLQGTPTNLWRLYYKQVIWVEDIRTNQDGQIFYQLKERYGSPGDVFWADARAFRKISEEEMSPINPESENKKIIVNINQQNLSCFENDNEVFFCRVSTGIMKDINWLPDDSFSTPVGIHWIWRKLYSLHMSGGASDSGWDILAVPWPSLFVGTGVAIHGTFWHNDFGAPKSHGCVNTLPEDAKWIYRWTLPQVPYSTGDASSVIDEGTRIEVIKPLY
jgi:hypothetical protein